MTPMDAGAFLSSLSTLSAPLLPAFFAGLAGSVHCIGMCGGIVGALSAAAPARAPAAPRVIAIASVAAREAGGCARTAQSGAPGRVLAYNGGRIASYALAGAFAGLLGQGLAGGALLLGRAAALQQLALWLANLVLVALGLHLMRLWPHLSRIEGGGQWLWRRLRPLVSTLLPMDSAAKAMALGGLWGWLPCAMVYSVLLTALLSGSVVSGAAVMLAFGLGTLPALTALGLAGARLRGLVETAQHVRLACGLLVLGFGLLGWWRAAHGAMPLWLATLCAGVHP